MRYSLIALAAVMAATPAIAREDSVTIPVTKADFASTTARAQLDRRIGAAVERLCGSYAAVETYQWTAIDDCRQVAGDQAAAGLAAFQRKGVIEVGSLELHGPQLP